MTTPTSYTARDLSAPSVWPPVQVVRRDDPYGPTGKVYAVYGDDDLTATRVKVAWGADADINPIYLGDRGRDENVADLIPTSAIPPLLRWVPETDDEVAQPATVFDATVVEYAATPGGVYLGAPDPGPEAVARIWHVDRLKPWLLVERGTRGGHWLSSHLSLRDALRHHTGQEYPDDWAIEEVIHHPTGIHVAGNGHELAIPSTINPDPIVGHVWVGGGKIKAYTGAANRGGPVFLRECETREAAHEDLIFHAIDVYTRAHRTAEYPT